jgi:hypothetical protein
MGGLRQRQDVGEFNGVPYLKDLKLVGRLFRSRDTEVRESELIVFIMPEIIPYADPPNCRQQIAGDTIDCRLNQVPEAEGCPPCCRRLPPGAFSDPSLETHYGVSAEPSPEFVPPSESEEIPTPTAAPPESNQTPDNSIDSLPGPIEIQSPEPTSATKIPSAELQFGALGRREEVRAMVDDGSLRRLPAVTAPTLPVLPVASPYIGKVRVVSQLGPQQTVAKPMPDRSEVRTAEVPVAATGIQY